LADQVADHHQTGGDAHPATERSASALQPGNRPGDRQTGPDRSLGVVLMRPRPAEIGEHTVAHELGNITFEARDLARDRVLVAAD
jgi:hypothetical protein